MYERIMHNIKSGDEETVYKSSMKPSLASTRCARVDRCCPPVVSELFVHTLKEKFIMAFKVWFARLRD
jgi:hypothetical protein